MPHAVLPLRFFLSMRNYPYNFGEEANKVTFQIQYILYSSIP